MPATSKATATAEPQNYRVILCGNPNRIMVRRDMSAREGTALSILPTFRPIWYGKQPEGMDEQEWQDVKDRMRASKEGEAIDAFFRILDAGDPVVIYVAAGSMDALPPGTFPSFLRSPYVDLLEYAEGDANVTVVTVGSSPAPF